MAYSSTVTVRRLDEKNWHIKIEEIDASSSSEVTIPRLANAGGDQTSLIPTVGTVTRQSCLIISGTGTTVAPVLGTATNPADDTIIVKVATAVADADVQGRATYYVPSAGANLYHRSNVNSGTNNVITTIYHITEGW